MQRFVDALRDHIKRRHTQQAAKIEAMLALFRDLLVVQTYATEDPVLQTAYEQARALVHYMTVKNALSDDEMREGMAKIGMTAEEIEKLMPVAQYQRDFLSEQGNFEHPAVKRARAKAPQRS